jgi:hypothetical protein
MPCAASGEESDVMGFYEVLDQVVQRLRQRGRVTYRALKCAFQLDDAFLEDLKAGHYISSLQMHGAFGMVSLWKRILLI